MSFIKKIMQLVCTVLCFVGLPFVVYAEEEMIPLSAAPSPYDNPVQAEIAQVVEMMIMNREKATQELTPYLQFRLDLSSDQQKEYGERLVDDMLFSIESEVSGETVQDSVTEAISNFENMLNGEQLVIWQTVKDTIRRIMENEKNMRAELPINNDIVIHSEAEEQLFMKQNNVTPTSLFMPKNDDGAADAGAPVMSVKELQTHRK